MIKILITISMSLIMFGCGIGTSIKQANSPECQNIAGVNDEQLKQQGFKLKSFIFNALDRTIEKKYNNNHTEIVLIERDGKIEKITCNKS
ncbi:MAG: hypothetical protein ABIN05_07905 [candidate division WOR-3 bacterium]